MKLLGKSTIEEVVEAPVKRGRGRPPKGTGPVIPKPTPAASATAKVSDIAELKAAVLALTDRIIKIEQILGSSVPDIFVPGLEIISNPDDPSSVQIKIDKTKCADWNEEQMIAVAVQFGLDLKAFRGQPREIRHRLYEELALHGVVL